MKIRRHSLNRLAYAAAWVAATTGLFGCGSDGSSDPDPGPAPLTVPRVAGCATGDTPETALQGQVPAAMRASGFNGFNCNLTLVGQHQGEGGNWSSATFTDRAGRTCAYHATAVPNANRQNPGVPVIDITDRAKPVRTGSLTTPAMVDPWESLRVNDRRQILIADNGQNGGGGPEVDIYDLSADCRSPQLMSSLAVGTGTDGGVKLAKAPVGHEGNISPDGLTYYIGDLGQAAYHAIDVTNTAKPKLIATYPIANLGLLAGTLPHGLSVSNDGNRMYGVVLHVAVGSVSAESEVNNGFAIFDTSEVQARKPNAQIKLVSKVLYRDGAAAQHTIPISVNGKPYVVMVDEWGSAGPGDTNNVKVSCANGVSPFPMARIYDVSDEKSPKVASKLMLETHDLKNCDQVLPDTAGRSLFTYGSHYCSVDNRDNATALACSYFNSGVRVFDIRNPERPKEIAYYNPRSASKAQPGSAHAVFGQWKAGEPDWCASRLDFDFAKRQLVTMCQDNGLIIMQFAPNTWPFPQSTASLNQS